MKRTYVILMLVLGVGGAALGVRRAFAGPGDPPAKMPLDVAIRLDRDLAHIKEVQARVAQAQAEIKPFTDDAEDIAREFKIDWTSYWRGDIAVDFKTGEIKRPAQVVAASQASADMGHPAKAAEKKK